MFDNMVVTISQIVAAIVIIVFLIFIVKSIVEFFKGQGGVLKIVGMIITVFVLVGVILAAQKYKTFGDAFSNVAEDAINGIADEAGSLFE